MSGVLDKLGKYYKSKGILATSFNCRSMRACKRTGTDSGPKSAFVGSKYGLNLPRLLFVSLDAGWAECSALKRTPMAVQEHLEQVGLEESAGNTHWFRTHEMAHALLSVFDNSLRPDSVTPYFAHTNSAKCCRGGNDGGKASPEAYLNCHRYLEEEIALLDPHVVVTQGQQAEMGVRALLVDDDFVEVDDLSAKAHLCGRLRFLLHTHHPRFAKGFYSQRKGSDTWTSYANHIREFMASSFP